MLCFLLDEHISPKLCEQIQRKCPEIEVFALQYWEGGRYLSSSDDILLDLAAQSSLTLVTYDLRTIPPLLAERADRGIEHHGVVFIDHRTIPPDNFGLLLKSLIRLWQLKKEENWKNRIIFLESSNL